MDEFNSKFIKEFSDLAYVRFVTARIDADNDRVTLGAIYDRSREKDYNAQSERIRNAAASLFPPFAKVSVTARPSVTGSRELIHLVRDFLQKESAYIAACADGDNISVLMGDPPSVSVTLTPSVAEYAEKENVAERLKEFIDARMFTDVKVRLKRREEDMAEVARTLNEKVYAPRFSYERPGEGRSINPTGRSPMCGEKIEGTAKYICDCIEPEYAVVYGTLLDLRTREYTPKKPVKGETTRTFASFVLDDGTGRLRCVWFPTSATKDAVKFLQNGSYYIMSGRTEYDERAQDGSLQMSVKRFTGCEKAEFEINKVVRLPDPDYRFTRPEKYESLAQMDMYGRSAKPLTDEDLVILSLMTVSDNKNRPGELIEIAAVRIGGGMILETMSSLMRPHTNMTEEERSAAGLVQSDINGKPYFEQILPDFYTFWSGRTVTMFPFDFNMNILKGYLDKLHIPIPETADMTLFAEAAELRRARAKTRRALPNALALAKFLTKQL